MGCLRLEYRWPLLWSVSLGDEVSRGAAARWAGRSLPVPNPGNLVAQPMTEIDRGLVQRPFRGRCPELKRVTVTAAPMAIVAAGRHVHRERAAIPRPGLV